MALVYAAALVSAEGAIFFVITEYLDLNEGFLKQLPAWILTIVLHIVAIWALIKMFTV